MAVYDTVENKRTELTIKTIECLLQTTNFHKHRIVVVDNNSCAETKQFLKEVHHSYDGFELITNKENVGTAKAVNQGWKLREPNEHLIKMDNDVIIHSNTWIDELEEAIERDPTIGILGLKRKDLWSYPTNEDLFWKSSLRMLPHKAGERWILVEDFREVMGTCQMYNYRLIEKMGGLYQMGSLYGFDDCLASVRCHVAGFKNCYLPHIEIEHIDKNETPYWKEKSMIANEYMAKYYEYKDYYLSGQISIYHEI